MDIVVQKFGGTSLETLGKVRGVAARVARLHAEGTPVVVVVSARGRTTDELLALAKDLEAVGPAREIDQLLATGETASAAQLALSLSTMGVRATSLSGAQAGIRVVGPHRAGVVEGIDAARIRSLLDAGEVAVVAGFQGVDAAGDILTLGRGGSDTTAVALAVALGAGRCEIHTDVDGVYTADPRLVPQARLLPELPIEVMTEMAFAGARVLHSRAVELAALYRLDVHVQGAFSDSPGTTIRGGETPMLETTDTVVAVTHDFDVARVLVHARRPPSDLASEVVDVFARHGVPLDLVARSGPHEQEFRMGCTIRRTDLAHVREPLLETAARLDTVVRIDENVGKLSLVGTGLLNRPQHTARLLSTLAAAGIPTSWVSTSQHRTSVVVPLGQVSHGLEVLHHAFGLTHRAGERPAAEEGRMTVVDQ